MSLAAGLLDSEKSESPSAPRRAQSCVISSSQGPLLSQKVINRRATYATARDTESVTVETDVAYVMTGRDIAKVSKRLSGLHKSTSKIVEKFVGSDTIDEGSEKSSEQADEAADGQTDALQTNGEATVNLLNNCLGSGLLAISFAISEAGIFVSLFLIVFAVLLNKYTLLLNLKTCLVGGCDPSSTDIGEVAFGKTGRAVMVFMYTAFGFFCMVSYVSASADCITGLMHIFTAKDDMPTKTTIMLVCWVVALAPPTLIRSLKGVAVLSFVAFIGGVVMVISLVICCSRILLVRGVSMDGINWWPKDIGALLTAAPLLCLAFAVQAGGGVVLATMKDTSQANIEKVASSAFSIVFAMDFVLGFIAYLAFLSATEGDVINNLPETSPIAALARLCLLDLVVLSYMIMCIPCKVAVIDYLFGKNEAKNEASVTQFYGTTLVLNVLALALAVSVPDLSLINGMNGSICTNFNAFIMPAAFSVMIRSRPVDKDTPAVPIMSTENIPLLFVFLFGFFMLFLGTYQLIQRFLGQ